MQVLNLSGAQTQLSTGFAWGKALVQLPCLRPACARSALFPALRSSREAEEGERTVRVGSFSQLAASGLFTHWLHW